MKPTISTILTSVNFNQIKWIFPGDKGSLRIAVRNAMEADQDLDFEKKKPINLISILYPTR